MASVSKMMKQGNRSPIAIKVMAAISPRTNRHTAIGCRSKINKTRRISDNVIGGNQNEYTQKYIPAAPMYHWDVMPH